MALGEEPPSLEWLIGMIAVLGEAHAQASDPGTTGSGVIAGQAAPGEVWNDEETVPDLALRGTSVEALALDETWPWLDDRDSEQLMEVLRSRGRPAAADGAILPHPDRLGRYHILGELGRGGFSVVYLAEEATLGRKVALKMARPERLASGDHRRRFLREAMAGSRLDHPNIVAIYEAGEADGLCYQNSP